MPCFLITLCSYTRTRFESHLTSSASRTHVQDDKDTIRSPRSSAILGPKKTKKSSIYKGNKKNKKKKTKKTKTKESFLFLPPYSRLNASCTRVILLSQSSMLFSSPSASFIHINPFLTQGISLAFDHPLPFPLLLPSLLTSRIRLDL